MSYEQAVKHSKNHRKDKYVQPCSGPVNTGAVAETESNSNSSEQIKRGFLKIIEQAVSYPIYVKTIGGGFWVAVCKEDSFATEIKDREEAEAFYREYVC